MRIVTWNINEGGAKHRYEPIVEALVTHEPDVIVLTEYQEKSQSHLAPRLREQGYDGHFTGSRGKVNGIYVAARMPFTIQGPGIGTDAPQRALRITIGSRPLSLLCLHIPGEGDKQFDKRAFWSAVLKTCHNKDTAPDIIIGDLNTGLAKDTQGTRFACMDMMQALLADGWSDAWRAVHGDLAEFTWYSSAKNGFRLDHCLVQNSLIPSVRDAYYSHLARESKISDHSLLVVDLVP